MQIVNININEIKPYPQNTKKHDETQIKNVAESIRQYGFVQPLVIDKDKFIVIGHCRFEAAKLLEMLELPCVLVDDLTEEQVNALRIVDNKTNESEWDFEILEDVLQGVDLSAFDLGFESFDGNFIDDLFDEAVGVREANSIDTFNITLVLPKEHETEIKEWYEKQNGKAETINFVINSSML